MTKEYIEREKAIEWFMAFVHMGESDIPAETVISDLKYAIPAADVVPAAHGELTEHIRGLLRAEKDGRLVILPCKVGERIYQVIPDYTAPDNSLFIEEDVFHLGLLTDSGELPANCYFTLEEAEKALED